MTDNEAHKAARLFIPLPPRATGTPDVDAFVAAGAPVFGSTDISGPPIGVMRNVKPEPGGVSGELVLDASVAVPPGARVVGSCAVRVDRYDLSPITSETRREPRQAGAPVLVYVVVEFRPAVPATRVGVRLQPGDSTPHAFATAADGSMSVGALLHQAQFASNEGWAEIEAKLVHRGFARPVEPRALDLRDGEPARRDGLTPDDARALGERWIKAGGDVRPGMLMLYGTFYAEGRDAGDQWWGRVTNPADVRRGQVPDPRDPATLGTWLATVRERLGRPALCVRSVDDSDPDAGWYIEDPEIYGATEAEALVAALEAAPR
jgi:hypothetical protein